MLYLLLGLAILIFLILVGRTFVGADPKNLATTLRKIGGWTAIVLAGLLAVTGRFGLAVPLAIVGATLLGRNFPFARSFPGGFGPFAGHANKSAGQRSKVSTAFVEMSLDHDSGQMDGTITKGQHAGETLSALDVETLIGLAVQYRRSDAQSAQLLEAYLDRREPDWRQGPQAEAAGAGGSGFRDDASGIMGVEEAYEVLGLKPGAGEDEVRRSHRTLMKKLHPDQGGSTYLAAKINQAKDVLLQTGR
jgi:hypothetical protein